MVYRSGMTFVKVWKKNDRNETTTRVAQILPISPFNRIILDTIYVFYGFSCLPLTTNKNVYLLVESNVCFFFSFVRYSVTSSEMQSLDIFRFKSPVLPIHSETRTSYQSSSCNSSSTGLDHGIRSAMTSQVRQQWHKSRNNEDVH